jgi:hypothetical protein
MAREILTEEERIRRRNESKQRYVEKKRREKELAKANAEEIFEAAPDYKLMYENATEENNLLKAKLAEYEHIIKSYGERERLASQNTQNIKLEANAKIQYMLDAAKHAYLSMQFAANSSDFTKEAK